MVAGTLRRSMTLAALPAPGGSMRNQIQARWITHATRPASGINALCANDAQASGPPRARGVLWM
jgi:hypothetical protein